MADRLISLMRERVVLIISNGQVGTGSFIASGQILTCAHVVRNSVVEKKDITILYYKQTKEKNWNPYELQVKFDQILLSPLVLDSEYKDIALIKVEIQNHPIIKMPSEKEPILYNSEIEYVALGFQKIDINTGKNIPQTVSLQYEGEEGGSDDLKIIFEDGMIRPGMSGAPLIERETGMITGLVQKTRNPNNDLGAYTIPIEKIWMQLKTWQDEGKSDIFQLLKSKKHRRVVRKQYGRRYSPIEKLKENVIPIMLLTLILFSGIFWVFRHFGTIDKAGWLAALIAALPIIGNYLGRQFNKEQSFLIKNIGQHFLKPVGLIVLGGIVIYLWAFKSSIWIYGSRDHAQIPITISSIAETEKSITRKLDRNGETRFLVNSSFFGRKYLISSTEYEPKAIEIRSLQKKDLLLPDSFILEPIVLLRINTDFLPDLENYYCLAIVGNNDTIKINNLSKERGSILLGNRRIDIESSLISEWRQTLESSGFNYEASSMYINGWSNYHYAKSNLSFNQKIDLEFYHKEMELLVHKIQYEISKTKEDIYVSF